MHRQFLHRHNLNIFSSTIFISLEKNIVASKITRWKKKTKLMELNYN